MAGGGRLNLLSLIAMFSILAVAPAVRASGCGLHPVHLPSRRFRSCLKERTCKITQPPAAPAARPELPSFTPGSCCALWLLRFRRMPLKFMSKGKMPSRCKMIQSAISVLQFSSMEERIWALNKILILLEDMYDVYYFMKYNGIESVIESLDSEEVEARAVSAWILGKVCQISPHLQNEDILISTTGNARLLRRAVFVADFAWYYLSVPDAGPFSSVASESLLISMVNVLNSTDFLLKKKAVFLLRKIMLHLKANEVTSMKEAGLDAALWNMLTELDVLEGEGEEEGVKDILGQTIHLIHLSTGLYML